MDNVGNPGGKQRRWPRLPQNPVTRRRSPTPAVRPSRYHAILSGFFRNNPDHSDLQEFNTIAHGLWNWFSHCKCACQSESIPSHFPSTVYTNITKVPF